MSVFLRGLRLAGSIYAQQFYHHLAAAEKNQNILLTTILRSMSHTPYGQYFKIDGRENYAAFCEKIPIVRYTDLEPWITKQKRHQLSQITPGSIKNYERTSGSRGPVKFIPYSPALVGSFQKTFAIWAWNVLTFGPHFESGRAYLSMSPIDQSDDTEFADDRSYLNWIQSLLVGRLLVLPDFTPMRDAKDAGASFLNCLSRALLACNDLEVISIWSPTFMLAAMRHAELQAGKEISWVDVWPKLKLISCWASANAAASAQALHAKLPHARLQPKGLLATEAPLTVPLWEYGHAAVPMLTEVFFEFRSLHDGHIYRLHELSLNQEYEIIITQKGGLLRYEMLDRVRCSGWIKGTPTLEFLGRQGRTVDMVGEKMSEDFLTEALDALLPASSARLVVPRRVHGESYHYILAVENPADLHILSDQWEKTMLRNFHYEIARRQGQLGPAGVMLCPNIHERYLRYYEQRGYIRGQIKPQLMIDRPVDDKEFQHFFASGLSLESSMV